GERRIRDRGGHARAAGRQPRVGHRAVPRRAAREGAQDPGVGQRSESLQARSGRGRLIQTTTELEAQLPTAYSALLRVEGFPRLVVSLLLGRIAGQMLTVSLVLFVLSGYHSPQLAGAAAFLLTFPGLCLSPIAGALLDRYGRARLVTVDYAIASAALLLLACLSLAHALPGALLLTICGVASLTGPLSAAGGRSLFPT